MWKSQCEFLKTACQRVMYFSVLAGFWWKQEMDGYGAVHFPQMSKLLTGILIVVLAILFAVPRSVEYPPLAERGLVLVTGASTGIGRHAVEALSRSHPGWVVLAGVRKSADAASISALGRANLRPLVLDAADAASRARALAEVANISAAEALPLLALVNNAGISGMLPLEFHDLGDARAMFEVNVWGAIGLTQLFLPVLRQNQGRIVMVSSVAGEITRPGSGIYSASKHALEAAADALRRELLPFRVSVSVVQPAYVKSAIFASQDTRTAALGDHDARRVYPHLYSAARGAKRTAEVAGGAEPTVTSDAIDAALTDSRPLTRHAVASAAGMPAWLIVLLAHWMPDRLIDLINT